MDLLLYVSLAGVVLCLVLLFYFISKYVNTEDIPQVEEEGKTDAVETPEAKEQPAAVSDTTANPAKKDEVVAVPPSVEAVKSAVSEAAAVVPEPVPAPAGQEEAKPAEPVQAPEAVPAASQVEGAPAETAASPVAAKTNETSLFPDKPEVPVQAQVPAAAVEPKAETPVTPHQPQSDDAPEGQEKHPSAVELLAAAKPSFNLALAKAERVAVQPPPKDMEDLVKLIAEVRSIIGRLDGMEPRFAVRLQPALRAIARELEDIKSDFGGTKHY